MLLIYFNVPHPVPQRVPLACMKATPHTTQASAEVKCTREGHIAYRTHHETQSKMHFAYIYIILLIRLSKLILHIEKTSQMPFLKS
jgi:hypothetical protein